MAQPTSDPMSYLEPIKQSSQEIKDTISQLSKVFPNEDINMRLVNWLWHYIRYNSPKETLHLANYDTPQGMIELGNVIANSDGSLDYGTIRTLRNEKMLNEEHIAWILQEDDQLRLKNWLNNVITKKIELISLFEQRLETGSELIEREFKNIEKIITVIDYSISRLEEKIIFLNQIKTEWEIFNSTRKIFSWFNKSNAKDKLKVAYNWLWDNEKMLTQSNTPATSPSAPHLQFETITDLIIYFDNSKFSLPEKTLFIERIKKRFNQAKYKESIKDKKQCNYVLKNKTILMLEKLAEKTGKSRTEIIESLINDAYQNILPYTQK